MSSTDPQEVRLHKILKKYWGYDSFRGSQPEVMRSVMAGQDTLALMPTGAGKSLTYQVPALAMEGLCVVVTPLIALMKDQVDALRRRGISAVSIHSGMSTRSIDITLDNCVYGDVKFLYVAPERIAGETFAARLAKMKVNLVAVDEAHCISQWGYDFRPSYLRISRIREIVPDAPFLALTASATKEVSEDIIEKLTFKGKNIIRSDFSRPNLSFSVRRTDDKMGQLLRVIHNVPGTGIVYARTREGTEKIAAFLKEEGVSAEFYHAGLPHGERSARQNDWMSGKTRVVIATTAFGMGIDKADVRFVVHYDVPASLEEYYQEAGRAGRDGRRSYVVLISGSDEHYKTLNRLQSEYPTIEQIKDIYNKLCSFMGVALGEGKFSSAVFNIYEFCARHKFFNGTVHNAIKILQQNGYLVYSEREENPARLMFCVSRDDLYSLRVQRDDLDHILRTILRLYTGVFTDFRPIDVQEIAIYSGYTEERVRELLKSLWQMHVIRYIPKNRSPMVFFADNRLPVQDVFISPHTHAMRRDMSARRIEAMFAYVESDQECRSVILQRYFGQDDAVPCGVCDVCLAARRKSKDKTGEKIVRELATGEKSVKELALAIPVDPKKLTKAVDELAAEGKIVMGKDGLVKIR